MDSKIIKNERNRSKNWFWDDGPRQLSLVRINNSPNYRNLDDRCDFGVGTSVRRTMTQSDYAYCRANPRFIPVFRKNADHVWCSTVV